MLAGLVLGFALGAPGQAAASSSCDLKGNWTVKIYLGGSLNNTQLWKITSGDTGSGSFGGETDHQDGSKFGTVSITVNGSAMHATNPYDMGGYVATFDGTVSADGTSMSGTWSDNHSQSGTFSGTLPSGSCGGGGGGGGGGGPGPGPSGGKGHPTGTSLSCNRGPNPDDSWTCTAQVGDADPTAPTAPGGTVTLASNNGGSFPSGNSCALTPSGTSTTVSSCSAVFMAAGGTTSLTASYGGDAGHNASSGTFSIVKSCIDSATLTAICTDPNAPAVCTPSGAIFAQCQVPTDPPAQCRPSGMVACSPGTSYVTACGSLGSLLPDCSPPPRSVPGVCGPADTGLPPCTPANNPITVCGPSGVSALPGCNFTTRITGPPIGLDGTAPGDVSVTIGCGGASASSASIARARAARSDCNVDTNLDAWIDVQRSLMQQYATFLAGQYFKAIDKAAAGSGAIIPHDQLVAFATQNQAAFLGRTGHFIPLFPPHSPRGSSDFIFGTTVTDDINRNVHFGPVELYSGFGVLDPPHRFGSLWQNAIYRYRERAETQTPAYVRPIASRRSAAASGPLAKARFKLRPGQRRQLRLRLSRAAVRALIRSRQGGARFAVVRLIVAVQAKPRPAVRLYDLRLHIKATKHN